MSQLSDKGRLRAIFKALSEIDEGASLVRDMKKNKFKVLFANADVVRYAGTDMTVSQIIDRKYIYGRLRMKVNRALPDANLIQSISHEQQHLLHHKNGVGHPDFIISDEDHCLLRRVQEADAQVKPTRIACLMKMQGDDTVFNEIQNMTQYGNMCDAFMEACANDPEAVSNGKADRAAFDAWFTEYNMNYYDDDTLTTQKSGLEKNMEVFPDHGFQPGTLTEEWVQRIGALSKVNYMKLEGHPEITSDHYRQNIAANIASHQQAPKAA